MQVKRFVAANMRLALNLVREELGPDAVILSNKSTPEGVELLTAVDEVPQMVAEPQAETENHRLSNNPFYVAADNSSKAVPSQPEGMSKLERELERMQSEARQRAEALAASLAARTSQAEKNSQQEKSGQIESVAATAIAEHKNVAVELDEVLAPERVQLGRAANNSQGVGGPQSLESSSAEAEAYADPVACSRSGQAADESELSTMRAELESMRDLMEQQFSAMAWGQYSQAKPLQAGLWRRLKRMGLSAQLSQQLLEQLVAHSTAKPQWQQLMKLLCQQVPVSTEDIVAGGGRFAFVGPTGAGKSTTIGKLAARYVLQHGAEGVALVTTDTFRIAAHEQLRSYGRILNVPVQVVDKNNSLERVLYALRHKRLVLIDSAGLNRQDARLKQQLAAINELGARVATLLVLPATSQPQVIRSAYQNYRTDNLQACVLTKLDEAASIGELISLVIEKSLPVAYSSEGQGVPDDIATATGTDLVRKMIALAKTVKTGDQEMAEDMASLRSLAG